MSLSVLDEPRTFPPKMFSIVVWALTSAIAIFGVVVSFGKGIPFWLWLVVSIIALRQIWVTRWVQVDNDAIRIRNVFHRGREILWEDITDYDENEFGLRKDRSFVIITITGTMRGRETTIKIDSDTVGFDVLRDIVRSATEQIKIKR